MDKKDRKIKYNEIQLLETILYEPPSGLFLIDRHIDRLLRSASFFELKFKSQEDKNESEKLPFEFVKNVESLEEFKKFLLGEIDKCVRVVVDVDGIPMVTSSTFESKPGNSIIKVKLDTEPTNSENIFLFHKTTHRKVYDVARKRAGIDQNNTDIFDVILYNENSEITECSIANIAIEIHDDRANKFKWKTPKIECGLLPGVMREYLLETRKEEFFEGVVSIEDLKRAQKEGRRILCFNSVRKEYQVMLID
ncbi:2040_t:CDS:2 [Ambispora gerdemannii]|uniref:2040_t:CDS:1 n=1 Tax=Ambispora gerdemannii TaxID=144530 RepID=A0A9N8V709_9GLOM|nr:2040_t:CDS:2 [Ambispora gerdemannii]